MANSISKLAYQTLQQGKSIAGLAHKQLSTRVMELVAPETLPSTQSLSSEMLADLQRSMTALQEQAQAAQAERERAHAELAAVRSRMGPAVGSSQDYSYSDALDQFIVETHMRFFRT